MLLGETPYAIDQRFDGEAPIPVAPEQAAVGIPKDLLRRRPDVRAAGLAAASQSALIGVAVANMYPAFSLAGAFGVASTNLGASSLADMFTWQNRVAQAGASFFFPVFNYGRLVNQVRVQDAVFQQAVLNYQNTVLTAQQEVEDGLSAFATSRQALKSLDAAATAAARSTKLSILQYKAGEVDYTTVVTSEQSQLDHRGFGRPDEGLRRPRPDLGVPRPRRRLGDPRGSRRRLRRGEGGDGAAHELGPHARDGAAHAEGLARGGTVNAKCLSIGGALALAALSAGCRKHADPRGPTLPAVTVLQPKSEPVTEYLEMTGTVAASKTVNLVARVPGYLESVNFKDGAVVPEGELLFVIEQPPYEAQVALNQAALVRAQAELDRQQAMMKENATAETTVENWVSQRDQAKAQLDLAKINLEYTKVKAPFAGRLGARQVDPGNLVGSSGPTVLATIEQLKPIYVNFNLNERDALHMRDLLRKYNMVVGSHIGKAPVEVGLQNEKGYPHVGVLDFADNALSTATGTIALRGVFANEDTTLFPGLFARVRIPLGRPAARARDPFERGRKRSAGRLRLRRQRGRRRRAAVHRQGADDRGRAAARSEAA